ncbi:MAG: hypothetical protein K0V04_19480 [Deltaproteobacteria bacterium]|nr:hypothetical protein [Deltaproteobacteria bacterium]
MFTRNPVTSLLAPLTAAGLLTACAIEPELSDFTEVTDEDEAPSRVEASDALGTPRGPLAATTVLDASQDTFIRSGNPNGASGDLDVLVLRRNGEQRVLVQFDATQVDDAIGDETLVSATLVLPVSVAATNWTPEGGTSTRIA